MTQAGFGGRIGRTFSESRPWWPQKKTAPEGAPNVVVILCDDLGFSDLGCYGSEIATPAIDRLASQGARYVNFHVPPMCTPTRAALLTGRNPHAVGAGYVSLADFGFPGYRGRLADGVPTIADIFRHNGYSTMMIGKWHLVTPEDVSEASDRSAMPLQRGFERFYGFAEPYGFTNFHHPHRLILDNQVFDVSAYPDGYYLTDDLTDRAISMIHGSKAEDPEKPVFLHFCHGAVHGPLQARAEDILRHRGRYDMGWDALRAARFARQKELGIVPQDAVLPARNAEPGLAVAAWDSLPAEERAFFARLMEIYAAMVESVDSSIARLMKTFEDLGQLDRTVFLFTSDNGASADGGSRGTSDYTMFLDGRDRRDPEVLERDYGRLDLLGGPRVLNHYPTGWAMASNTPFRLYKASTYAGGHQVPMIMSWPGRIPAGTIRRQYAHVTDVLPTLVDMLALDTDLAGKDGGGFDGASFAGTAVDADAPSLHDEQYTEIAGNRSYQKGGMEIVSLRGNGDPNDAPWSLYDQSRDPTQVNDLAGERPDTVERLAQGFEHIARRNQVFPLDDGHRRDIIASDYEARIRPVTLFRGSPTFEPQLARYIVQERAFAIDVHFSWKPGDQGVLVAHGDQGGGYVLYVEDDRLVFAQNAFGKVERLEGATPSRGPNRVRVEVTPPSARQWDVAMFLDGAACGSARGWSMLNQIAPFEGIDVGIDRRSPVLWDVYERHGPFPFSGEIEKVVYAPGAYVKDSDRDRAARFRMKVMQAD